MNPPDLEFPYESFINLPPEERDSAYSVRENIHRLTSILKRVAHALALFDYAEAQQKEGLSGRGAIRERRNAAMSAGDLAALKEADSEFRALEDRRRMYGAWMNIAARDIVVATFDLRLLMKASQTLMERDCKTLWGRINRAQFLHALKLHVDRYPRIEAMRDAACHLVDYSNSPADVRKNSVTGPVNIGGVRFTDGEGSLMATSILHDRTIFFTGHVGQLKGADALSLEITQTLLVSLTEIASTATDAFRTPQPAQ